MYINYPNKLFLRILDFVECNTGFLMPNPNSSQISQFHLKIFELSGFIIGVGLLHDIKLVPNFSVFYLNNILEIENPFTELKSYDPDLFKNLVNLKIIKETLKTIWA
jgi:hypothetical protein